MVWNRVAIVAILIILVYGVLWFLDIPQSLFRNCLSIREGAWENCKSNTEDDFGLYVRNADYIGAAYVVRKMKCKAERYGVPRKKYLAFLRRLKNAVPKEIGIDALPYDMRVNDESLIIYGLFSYNSDLTFDARRSELQRFAEEIRDASELGNYDVLSQYDFLLDMLTMQNDMSSSDRESLDSWSKGLHNDHIP